MSPQYEQITSFQNAKVKQIKRLRDRRSRDHEGRFVIDDGRDLARALDCGYMADYAFFCPALGSDDGLLDRMTRATIYEVPRDIMEKAAYRQNPSPLLAVMVQKPPLSADDLNTLTEPLILALVDLRKPGNIGALLRTADAAGFRAVFLADSDLDIYNPNVIRSSTGACFLGNIYMLSSADALGFFRGNGYAVIAAAVDGERSMF
jgi:RNA methyltransferase, TrmH family